MAEDAPFSAKDVQQVAGLSYRQINDWDERGALPHDRPGEQGWRRFTASELFIVLVCAELRRRFGIPLNRLRFVREFMSQEGANHLRAAAELMAIFGVGVWLLTDLEETFIMDSELEIVYLAEGGFFGGERESAYLLLNVTPLVNKLLAAIPDLEPIEAHGLGYEILRQTQGTLLTRDEAFVVQSLKQPDVHSVEVTLKDGRVETVRTSQRKDPSAALESLLADHDYQKLSIIKKEGHIVSVDQQSTTKPQA